jgi:hypothetical protein
MNKQIPTQYPEAPVDGVMWTAEIRCCYFFKNWRLKEHKHSMGLLVLRCLFLAALFPLFASCGSKKAEFVAPREAAVAVAAARQYAETNGCERPTLCGAQFSSFGGGVWVISLRKEKTKELVVLQVSPEGKIVSFSGIR